MLSAMSWGAIPASTLVICAVPDFVTWAVGHLSAVSDDPHQLCQAGRYFSSEKSKNIKSLTRYVLLSVCISTVVNLLTISPLRNSDSFVTEGQWLTFKSIIALLILCGVVLAINLFFSALLQAVRFSGQAFFCRKSICFSPVKMRCRPFFAKPLWLRLFILLVIEVMWITLVSVLATLVEWRIWFEAYFFTLLCTVLNLLFFLLSIPLA